VIAILLVILVVYLFLQDLAGHPDSPMLAVPVSLVGTFALFPLFGFSINTLVQCWGLVLAIGFGGRRRDCSCRRCGSAIIEEGLAPKDAAMKAIDRALGTGLWGIALVLASVVRPYGRSFRASPGDFTNNSP